MRARFRLGWGLAWGLVAAAIMSAARGDLSSTAGATVYAYRDPSLLPFTRALILYAGCGLAAALGGYIAASAMDISRRARWLSTALWAAIGAATVAANFYLANHPGPDWWYETVTRSASERNPLGVITQIEHWNPWSVHLDVTLPLAGAIGGLLLSLVTTAGVLQRRVIRAAVWTGLWSVSFLAAKVVGVITVYLGTGAVIDLFEAAGLSAAVGGFLGSFLGGAVAGLLMGAAASFSPAINWRTTVGPADGVHQLANG